MGVFLGMVTGSRRAFRCFVLFCISCFYKALNFFFSIGLLQLIIGFTVFNFDLGGEQFGVHINIHELTVHMTL
jgi:hypothetical protein